MPRELDADSQVEFFELRIRAEGDGNVVVGRADTGDFVSLPELGAQIIHQLKTGARIAEVERNLSGQGIEIDIADFVKQLSEFGFVRAVDGISDPNAPSVRSASLPWLRACHVRWLFTWRAYLVYFVLMATAAAALVVQPRVRPRYGDIFFSGSTTLVLLGSTVIFMIIAVFHEFAHLASARASGVPARISFGTRLYWLVVQTDVSGMWSACPRERLRTYLAGVGMDLIFGSVLVLERAVHVIGGTLDHIIAAAVVYFLIGIAGQFLLFMRTDMYFVAAHLLRARNLFEDATVQFVHTLRSLAGKAPAAHPLAGLPDRERRAIRGYSVVMVLGTLGALTVLGVYVLPAMVKLLASSAHRLFEGISYGNFPLALDGGVALLLAGGTELFVVGLTVRSRMSWINSLRGRLRQSGETAKSASR